LKARCCETVTSKAWMNRIKIECNNYNRDPKEADRKGIIAKNIAE